MNKRWFAISCAFFLVFSLFTQSSAAPTLRDIKNHWAKEYVERAIDQGIITGYPDGTFQPDRALSRAEFATIQNSGDTSTSRKPMPKAGSQVSPMVRLNQTILSPENKRRSFSQKKWRRKLAV